MQNTYVIGPNRMLAGSGVGEELILVSEDSDYYSIGSKL
jgi:hypothetical protein